MSNQKKLFGTDGVRGVANREPMMVETAVNLARAVAHVLKERKGGRRPRVLVGKDTRLSGYMIENALVAGLCSMGADAILAGTLPTPGIAVLVIDQKADAGLVISASHNPFEDNGIKLFSADGYKLPDEEEAEIEALATGTGCMSCCRRGAASGSRSGWRMRASATLIFASARFRRIWI